MSGTADEHAIPAAMQNQSESTENTIWCKSGRWEGWKKLSEDALSSPVTSERDESVSSEVIAAQLRSILNCETLVVLAGSGTSLGIHDKQGKRCAPSMGDLWEEVSRFSSCKEIKTLVAAMKDKYVNIEHVLSEVQMRIELERLDSGEGEGGEETKLECFLREAEEKVWDATNFVNAEIDPDLRAHQRFLRKLARRPIRLQRLQLFTTNYDRAFEQAALNNRFNVIDGFGFNGVVFDGRNFDTDYVMRKPGQEMILESNVFQLLKLHGSVDWAEEGKEVVRHYGSEKPEFPVLIYPSSKKYQLSYKQPYLECVSRFQNALRAPSLGLIVVGFGFNDDHLTEPVRQALRANVGMQAVFVAPDICQVTQSHPSETLEGPVINNLPYECFFGEIAELADKKDKRLLLLSSTFDEFVDLLPEVMGDDENELHWQRVMKSDQEL